MYLTQGLHRALQRHPAKVALRHLGADAQRELTFERFVSDVARQAAALRSRGMRAGDRVAMLSPNNDALVVQLFACWWLGAVACPLNVRWSVAELLHALGDCGARLLLVHAAHGRAASELQNIVTVLPADVLAAQAQDLAPLEDARAGGDALAAILYTGGTTGRAPAST